MFERTLRTKRIYRGRIVGLRDDTVLLSNGVTSHREVVEHPGAVAVIAVTRDRKLVLIRQFRKSAEKVLLEIPAGLVHKGERAVDGAKRELIEEAGYKAGRIREVFSGYSSPGYSTEIIRFYLATDLVEVKQCCEEDEMISVRLYPVKKALELVKKGRIRDNKTALGILFANLTPNPSPW